MAVTLTHTAPNTWKATVGSRIFVVRKFTAMKESTFTVFEMTERFTTDQLTGALPSMAAAKAAIASAAQA